MELSNKEKLQQLRRDNIYVHNAFIGMEVGNLSYKEMLEALALVLISVNDEHKKQILKLYEIQPNTTHIFDLMQNMPDTLRNPQAPED